MGFEWRKRGGMGNSKLIFLLQQEYVSVEEELLKEYFS